MRGFYWGNVWRVCLCALGFVCFGAVPACALTVHKFSTECGGAGSGLGQFSGPTGVAVDGSDGYVYVADTGNNRVERFSGDCIFLGWFDGSGSYEVEGKVETGVKAAFGVFSTPDLVAVDTNMSTGDPSRGDLYVLDKKHAVIDKFSALGEYVGAITEAGTCASSESGKPGFQSGEALPCSVVGLAVDPSGNVWVAVRRGEVFRFTNAASNQQSSECTSVFGEASRLAVDVESDFYFEVNVGEFGKMKGNCEAFLDLEEHILFVPFCGDEHVHSAAVDSVAHLVFLDNESTVESCDLEGNPSEGVATGAAAEPFGSGSLGSSGGVAVDTVNDFVYASDVAASNLVVFSAVTLPTVTVEDPSEQEPRAATLRGSVNPEGSLVESCVFEVDTVEYKLREAKHGTVVGCSPGSVGSGLSPVPVSARFTGLTPETRYFYRLSAANAGGTTEEVASFFTGPLVEGEWSTGVSAFSATIASKVDPNGGNTSYFVEYGSSPALGSYAPVGPPGVGLGSTVGPKEVKVHLQGLSASITYFYRVVAVQDGEAFSCDPQSEAAAECDTSFVTGAAPVGSNGLLDGRGWELVSPPDKKGALIEAQSEQGGQVQAADHGDGISYVTRGPGLGENARGNTSYSQVLSTRRAPGAWRSRDLTLPARHLDGESEEEVGTFGFIFEYRLFSPSLSSAMVEPAVVGTPPLAEDVSERTLYVRNNEHEMFLPLVGPFDASSPIEPVTNEHTFWELHELVASPDLSHVVFKTPMALVEPAVDEESPTMSCSEAAAKKILEPRCYEPGEIQWNLYEWSAGRLGLVNVLPEAKGESKAAFGRASSGVGGVRLAGTHDLDGYGHGGAQRSLSSDGRRVAWTWGEPFTSSTLEKYRGLYVRDMSEERTVRVGGASASYQTMSSDGSRIFYIENGELYEYTWELGASSGVSVDLTGGHGVSEPDAGVQESVSDVSDDGSYVYFVAMGVLAPGAVSGGYNLYLLQEVDGVWSTSLVATLGVEDRPSWYAAGSGAAPLLPNVSSRVSPNGRFLVFMSDRPLTGYDNVDVVSGQRDEEVFLYDSRDGKLVCVSCNPSGARPAGVFDTPVAELLVDRQAVWTSRESGERDPRVDHWLGGSVPGWDNLANTVASYQPRYLSDSGRVFFDSPVGLVSHDTNGLEDVYVFEPVGVGGCSGGTSSGTQVFVGEVAGHAVDGCVGLVSSGTSGSESAFLDASEDGGDVFFVSASKLSGQDVDKGYDVYDAHVCTGALPCPVEGVPVPPCLSGDSCKPPPSPQPENFGAPASETFEGVGNAPSPPSASKSRVSNAQKLARTLRKCRKERGRRRVLCERRARAQPSRHARQRRVRIPNPATTAS